MSAVVSLRNRRSVSLNQKTCLIVVLKPAQGCNNATIALEGGNKSDA